MANFCGGFLCASPIAIRYYSRMQPQQWLHVRRLQWSMRWTMCFPNQCYSSQRICSTSSYGPCTTANCSRPQDTPDHQMELGRLHFWRKYRYIRNHFHFYQGTHVRRKLRWIVKWGRSEYKSQYTTRWCSIGLYSNFIRYYLIFFSRQTWL